MQGSTKMAWVLPYHEVCPHCGKELKKISISIAGRDYEVGCWASCGCAESLVDDDLPEYDKPYALAGIPKHYIDAKCDLLGHEFAVVGGKSLYITGPNGSGKTYFACALAKKLIEIGKTVLFTTSVDLIDAVHASYGGAVDPTFDMACGCDVLILDDLGKENTTRSSLEILFTLVNYRYSEGKPTVITSNFTRGELADRWDSVDESTSSSIVSRLCENSGIVQISGRDRRLQ